jgi:hypothetical protein
MTITLRQESATGATTKGSALTYSELDNNFVHLLRQGSVSVGADSGTQQTLGEADRDSLLNIIGGTDISTTVSAPDSAGATTVEIAFTGSAGIANVVEDATPQLGGDLDAQSNNITSLGTLNTHTIPGGTGTFALTSDITFTEVVDDTTPQLGGDLDLNSNDITGTGNVDITGTVVAQSTLNTQTGTTYTLVLTDASKLVTLNNAAAITLTIPPNSSVAFPVGTKVDLVQLGAGTVTVAEGSGVTVNATPTKDFRAQYSAASCIKIATDEWVLVGDLASA